MGGDTYDPGFGKGEGFLLLFVVFDFDKLLRIEQIWDGWVCSGKVVLAGGGASVCWGGGTRIFLGSLSGEKFFDWFKGETRVFS